MTDTSNYSAWLTSGQAIEVTAECNPDHPKIGQTCLTLDGNGHRHTIHNQTAGSLERLAHQILDCARKQREADAQRELATPVAAAEIPF